MRFKAVLLSLIFLAGCAYETRPASNPHAAARANEPTSEPAAVEPIVAIEESGVDWSVLDPQIAIVSRKRADTGLQRRLDRVNQEILRASLAGEDVSARLDQYSRALMAGCDAAFKGCRALDFFRKSATSYRVAMLLAARAESRPGAYYRFLQVAYMIKNVRFDIELSLMYLKLAGKHRRDETFEHTIKTVLTDVTLNAEPAQARRALELFSPLRLKRGSGDEKSGLNFTRLLESASRFGLFYGDKGVGLAPELLAVLREMSAESDSFQRLQSELVKSRGDQMARLGMEKISSFDEVFFLVDRVYRGELRQEDAAALWAGVRGENRHARLVETLRRYVAVRFFEYLQMANRRAKVIFARPVASEYLLEYAYSHSFETEKIWDRLRERLKPLTGFTLAVLKKDMAAQNLIERASDVLDGFELNVKYTSTYAHMIMLAHKMSKANFKRTYRLMFGGLEIDSALVVNNLFSGLESRPWFGYSLDTVPLTQSEVLYALDLAVKTGALETFGIDPADFLRSMQARLEVAYINPLENMRRHYRNLWGKSAASGTLAKMASYCQGLRSGKAVRRQISFAEFANAPYLGDLFPLYLRQLGDLNPLQPELGGLSIYGAPAAEALETVRLDLVYTERLVRAMKLIFQNSGRTVSFVETDAFLARLQSLRTDIPREYGEFHRRYAQDCLRPLFANDFRAVEMLVQAEERHLRRAYRDLQELRAARGPREASLETAMRARYHLHYGNALGFETLTRDGYIYSSFDVHMRGIKHLKEIAPEIDVLLTADMRETKQYYNSRTTLLRAEQTEDQFVDNGLAEAFLNADRMVPWFTLRGRPAFFGEYINGQLSLYFAEGSGLTARDLVREIKDWLPTFAISDYERRLLARTAQHEKFPISVLQERLYRVDLEGTSVVETYGLYDFVVDGTQQEVLATDYFNRLRERDGGVKSSILHPVTPSTAARAYFNSRLQKSHRVYFETTPALDRYLYRSYWEPVVKFERASQLAYDEVRAEIARLEKGPASARPFYDVDLQTTIREPFLSPRLRENFSRNRVDFHNDTQNCFRSQATSCAAFRGLSLTEASAVD